ncbi:MAG: hypothetical protein RR806_03165 [Oscillospiraceae bacterium]
MAIKKDDTVNVNQTTAPTINEKPLKSIKKAKSKMNLSDMVLVKNGFYGRLVVHLPKAGYDIFFDSFGDEDYIELAELKTLRNSSQKFFSNGWIIIDDPDAIEFLMLESLYKNTLSIENLGEVLSLPLDEMEVKISAMSDGQKKSITYRVLELIDTGEIDSRKVIDMLEKALNTELVEK